MLIKPSTGKGWRRVGGGSGKGQQSKEADVRLREWKDISPGNIRSGIGSSSWVENDMLTTFDFVGSSNSSEGIPYKPPATSWGGKGGITGMVSEKMAVVVTIGSAIRGRGGGDC